MRRIGRIALWMLAGLVVLVAVLLLYLRNADLSVFEPHIESFVSNRIGHVLSIDGRFELHFGATTRVVAEEVSLSNPEWEDGEIVSARHASIAVDTWSLFSRPLVVEELEADTIRVALRRREDGTVNWAPTVVRAAREQRVPFDPNRIAFRFVEVDDVSIEITSPRLRRPVNAAIEFVTVTPDDVDVLDLDARGTVNELPIFADGKLGPWQNFVEGRDIEADLDLALGQWRLAVEGSVEDVRNLEGVELLAELTGPEIESVIERLGLPPFASGDFALEARSRKLDGGHQVRVDGKLGNIELFASGSVDRFIGPSDTSYDFRISGPNARYIAELFGIDGVPDAAFQISGDVAREATRLTLKDTRAEVGRNSIAVDGWLDFVSAVPDGDLSVTASGPDLSIIAPFAGLDGVPRQAFELKGRLRKTGLRWQFDDVAGNVGPNRVAASGAVEAGSRATAQIDVSASGPDISFIADMTGLQGIPSRTYDVSAIIKSAPIGLKVEQGRGEFGDNRILVDGLIGIRDGMQGTSLDVHVEGPELHNVELLTGVPHLPDGPFEADGNVGIDRGDLTLADVNVRVGGLSGNASGRVGLGDAGGRFDLDVTASGLYSAGVFPAAWLDDLIGESFSISGHIVHNDERYEADRLELSFGGFEAEVDGFFVGAVEAVEVTVRAGAQNSGVLRELLDLDYLPEGPVAIEGTFAKTDSDLELAGTVIRLGGHVLTTDGKLSLQPLSNDSDLEFAVSGPSLQQAGRIGGMDFLPDRPFDISGRVDGIPTGFAVHGLQAKLGDNDINGELSVDLRGEKPKIIADLASAQLDITEDLQQAAEMDEPAEADGAGDGEFVFSTEPLATSWLQATDIDLNLSVDHFIADTLDVTDVQIGFEIQDGALQVNPFRMRDEQGSVDGRVSLAPVNGRYSMDASLSIDQVYIGQLDETADDSIELPSLSGQVTLNGTGNSLHAIMASSNGQLSMRQGSGQVKDLFASRLFRDLLMEVLRTLNPLRRSREYQMLECGIYEVSVKDGVASIDQFAIQTDTMTTVASGEIDLRTERLEIGFRAKPREGLGISLGTVANQFLELRGTLTSPRISLDTRSSVTTTGAAVATGGLSLLARGLWDRLSAETSICEDDGGPATSE